MSVRLVKAEKRDAEALADISRRAFHSDAACGAPSPEGGPPGYDAPEFQERAMRWGDYYCIVLDDDAGSRTVGGLIVRRDAPREYVVERIFVDPEVHNRGIGAEAFERLWEAYPLAKRWTLDTPTWNVRTRHFYPKVGFREVGVDGHGGVLFERRVGGGRAP